MEESKPIRSAAGYDKVTIMSGFVVGQGGDKPERTWPVQKQNTRLAIPVPALASSFFMGRVVNLGGLHNMEMMGGGAQQAAFELFLNMLGHEFHWAS